jgi:hypothetical protein
LSVAVAAADNTPMAGGAGLTGGGCGSGAAGGAPAQALAVPTSTANINAARIIG